MRFEDEGCSEFSIVVIMVLTCVVKVNWLWWWWIWQEWGWWGWWNDGRQGLDYNHRRELLQNPTSPPLCRYNALTCTDSLKTNIMFCSVRLVFSTNKANWLHNIWTTTNNIKLLKRSWPKTDKMSQPGINQRRLHATNSNLRVKSF